MSIHLNRINPKGKDIICKWHVIDADGQILGRLASEIAKLLMGKNKLIYASNLLSGDFVIVINSKNVRLTGNKSDTKKYWRHSGYPGGLTEIPFNVMKEKDDEYIIKKAVKGMLPKNKMGDKLLGRLKVYGDENHPHESQIIASEKGLQIIYDQNFGNTVKSDTLPNKVQGKSSKSKKAKNVIAGKKSEEKKNKVSKSKKD